MLLCSTYVSIYYLHTSLTKYAIDCVHFKIQKFCYEEKRGKYQVNFHNSCHYQNQILGYYRMAKHCIIQDSLTVYVCLQNCEFFFLTLFKQ